MFIYAHVFDFFYLQQLSVTNVVHYIATYLLDTVVKN